MAKLKTAHIGECMNCGGSRYFDDRRVMTCGKCEQPVDVLVKCSLKEQEKLKGYRRHGFSKLESSILAYLLYHAVDQAREKTQ